MASYVNCTQLQALAVVPCCRPTIVVSCGLFHCALPTLLDYAVDGVKCLSHIAVGLPHHQHSRVRQALQDARHTRAPFLVQLLQDLQRRSCMVLWLLRLG